MAWTNLRQPTKEQILEAWQKAAEASKAAVAAEMELRKAAFAAYFPSPDEGTNTIDLANGWKLKGVHKMNYNLGGAVEVNTALETIGAMDAEGKFIAERLVSWKPSLSISEYRTLPAQYKRIIDTVLTTKDAAPTLELKEPKVVK